MEAVLRALADQSRRTMLETLAGGPVTVGELAALLPIARPGVSRHLRVLREAGLVEARQEAQPLDKIAFYGAGWQIHAEISPPTSPGVSAAAPRRGGTISSLPIRTWRPTSASDPDPGCHGVSWIVDATAS